MKKLIIFLLILIFTLTGCVRTVVRTVVRNADTSFSDADDTGTVMPLYAESLSSHLFITKEDLLAVMDWPADQLIDPAEGLADENQHYDLVSPVSYLSRDYSLRLNFNPWDQGIHDTIREYYPEVDTENLFLGEDDLRYLDSFIYTTEFAGENAVSESIAAATEIMTSYTDTYGEPVKDRFAEKAPEAALQSCFDCNQQQLVTYVVWNINPVTFPVPHGVYPSGVYQNVRVGLRTVVDPETGLSQAISLTIEYAISFRADDIG